MYKQKAINRSQPLENPGVGIIIKSTVTTMLYAIKENMSEVNRSKIG